MKWRESRAVSVRGQGYVSDLHEATCIAPTEEPRLIEAESPLQPLH